MTQPKQLQASSAPRIYTGFALVFIAMSLILARNIDFRVYWYGVHDFFQGTRPAYGLDSGIGYPLEYRYPPATYLLLYPLRAFSLRLGGFLWMMAACTTAAFAVSLAIRIRGYRFNKLSIMAASGYLLAYVFLAVRYGNVQPFVIAWLFMALVLAESKPLWAGVLLTLAITFKIWPIMFVPWFLRRTRLRAAGWFVVSLAVLWLSPVLVFGVAGYKSLLMDWYNAVGRLGTTYSEFYYFPGQSLRGLLLRYVSTATPPLKNFPDIHILSLAPHTAIVLWGILAIGIYSFFAIQMLRSDRRKLWAWDGLVFVLYSLLEPYAVKSGLISVGPAVLTAACLFTLGASTSNPQRRAIQWASRFFLIASLISFLLALIQYGPWQRFLLTIGMDFWAGVALLLALFVWLKFTTLPESLPNHHH